MSHSRFSQSTAERTGGVLDSVPALEVCRSGQHLNESLAREVEQVRRKIIDRRCPQFNILARYRLRHAFNRGTLNLEAK